ncbi:MAG: 3-deoxy-manno-octulosonate cytidylyltransferase [SAR324 cluster bacterium]|nr:3-deoxy-manno-octulosonate cytidylyltransferase [SAR324 cluster bacterium]
MQTRILGVIPSRYASTRFPGKALADIAGKTLIHRVYERVVQTQCLTDVIVATDDERIFNHVLTFGGKALMTSTKHQTGTDRCFETLSKSETAFDYVINIQGDEPFIRPEQIEQIAACCQEEQTEVATLVSKIEDPAVLFDRNSVRVVINSRNEALYFSRSTIPFLRGKPKEQWISEHTYYQHIGMYGYRRDVLKQISTLIPSSLEKAESLEQLRWLEAGIRIKVGMAAQSTIGIDTPEDLKYALQFLDENAELR